MYRTSFSKHLQHKDSLLSIRCTTAEGAIGYDDSFISFMYYCCQTDPSAGSA